MEILNSILAFLIAISLLVAIHEFGHFWVAKLLGVKVLRYSIGFGRPLIKKTWGKDQTEYVIASLPLGGYVKMLDEREGDVLPEELDRAFNRQNVYKRFAIVFAGPLFNFIFAFFAYWLMLGVGVTGLKPVIGDIKPDSIIAQAGIKKNDEIVSINQQTTPIWDVALKELITAAINKDKVEIVTRYQDSVYRTVNIDFNKLSGSPEPEELIQTLGIKPWRPVIKPVIGKVLADSPANRAGLQVDDEIIRIDSTPITDWFDLVSYVSVRPGQEMKIQVLRNGQRNTLVITTGVIVQAEKKIGRLGVAVKEGAKYPDEMKASYQYSMLGGIPESVAMVWKNSVLTLKMIGKLIMGEVSLKNLSGPINIAVYAGYSASAGFSRFLDFLAIVSISLGIINLLPVPVLDGGHLMYYLIEFVRGKPVSERVEALGQRIGILLLMMMMSVAIVNDIFRLLGK